MEAEKSQELQLSSWRPGRAEGVSFGSKSSRLNNQEKMLFQSEFKGQKRPKSQAVRQEFPPAFCPIQDWMGSTCIREGQLLYAVYRFKCQFHPKNILTDIPRIMCDEMSGHFLAQSAWHIKLIITGTHYSITNIICNTKELKTISLSIHSNKYSLSIHYVYPWIVQYVWDTPGSTNIPLPGELTY